MEKILFTNTTNVPQEYAPQPASKIIPDWYKNLSSYIGDEKKPSGMGTITSTAKRCMPIFDSISFGYIIPTCVDIYVSQRKVKHPVTNEVLEDSIPWYEWPTEMFGLPIEFHPIEQLPEHPLSNSFPYPKWINPWSIKTPPGYSTLFITPLHRPNIFTLLPGVVDTDRYYSPVNFPFTLNDPTFEGLIPAGTPMVQVIPFKRDAWEMSMGDVQDHINQMNILTKLRSRFFDSYKNHFRQVKEYK